MTVLEYISVSPAALALLTMVVGLIVGSFLNVVIYRLPIMMERQWTAQCNEFLEIEGTGKPGPDFRRFDLASPGSHCPSCNHSISALENIPLLSYLIQGGKCRHCRVRISPRYPAVEAATAILSVLVVLEFGFQWQSLAALGLTWSLIALTMVDYDHQLLPDDITLPLLWAGLVVNAFGAFTTLVAAFWGAVAGYLILWAVYWAFRLLTGKEGLGFGDFKLLAALGAWTGWQALPQIILISSLFGAVVGIALIALRGRDRNVPIPFGPYLAAAGFAALLWGDQINQFYYRFMGL